VAFVLNQEPSLNAFAAGLSTQDSVIGVTRGLLEAMNRDELQGVIAHEVGHIVNGDSRLNLKLIGTLYGISALSLMGRGLMRMRGATAVFGFSLCLIGAIGLFFGRLIQAAVSREREYLADAFAVQFTRNPGGLSSALKKLRDAGSIIQHPQAEAASHLFLGASDVYSGFSAFLFDTHPPLAERIRRIGGIWLDTSDEERLPPIPVAEFGEGGSIPVLAANPHAAMPAMSPIAALTAPPLPEEILPDSLNQAQILLSGLPYSLRQPAGYTTGAIGILAGLFFSGQPEIRLQQENFIPSDALTIARELYQWLSVQPEAVAHYRLVWLDIVLPT
jgi:Zn-dependent protease with chaperone function